MSLQRRGATRRPLRRLAAASAIATLGLAPVPTAGDPWALGYAIVVARACANWRMEPQRVLAERGMLARSAAGSGMVAIDGEFERRFYEGQAEAEADRRADRRFCGRVPQIARAHWARLGRILVRQRP